MAQANESNGVVPADIKIAYALWHYSPGVNSEELRRKCRALTLHTLRLCSSAVTPVDEDFSLSRILSRAVAAQADWCVVLTPGNVIKPGFFSALKNACRRAHHQTFAFGNFVDGEGGGFGFHEQLLMVNLQAWKSLVRPKIGWPQDREALVIRPERSQEFVCHPGQPCRIGPSAQTYSIRPTSIGWNLIDQALRKGYHFEQVPQEVREKIMSIYSDQNSELVEAGLAQLGAESFDLDLATLSSNQREVFTFLKMEAGGHSRKVYLFNTEGYGDVAAKAPALQLDALYGVASGFKDLHLLRQYLVDDSTKLVYFDISSQALSLKQIIYSQWNGYDFPAFLKDVLSSERSNLSGALFSAEPEEFELLWQKELAHWPSEEAFREAFLRAKRLPKEFLLLDLLERPGELAQHMLQLGSRTVAVWYSNCFNYTPALAKHDWKLEWIESRGRQFLESLHVAGRKNALEIELIGEDVVFGARCRVVGKQVADIFG